MTRLATLLLLGLGGCSRSLATPDAATPDAGTTPGICDGSPDLRLAFQVSGGGPTAPGETMLSENGWRFLLVDGTCQAWVLKDSSGPLVRTVLSPDDEAQLATALELSAWNGITPPPGGCPDANGTSFRFRDQRLSGVPCGADPASAWAQLNTAADAQLDRLAASGTAWAGDLRYVVLRESSPNDPRPPVAWPLATPLATIVRDLNQGSGYRRGDSLRATGDDASKLRAIRTTAAGASSTYGVVYDFTRVSDAEGATYQLYVRDALPFEQDDGLVPPGVF